MKRSSRSWLPHNMKCWPFSRSDSTTTATKATTTEASTTTSEDDGNGNKRELGGWKCMPYIIGNETFEKVASFGLTANFTLYLVKHYHMEQVAAAQATNIFSGTTNFAPLLGAFISDAYIGRFRTLAYTSIASFMGIILLTFTATVPQFQPPSFTPGVILQANPCPGATKGQLSVLILSLLLIIGAAGIRPCSLPFGIHQFDRTTEQGRRSRSLNWYYYTSTAAMVVSLTVVVYIQDNISWAAGFGIPAGLMLVALVMFYLGTGMYDYVQPEGSVFSGIAQVFVAAVRKRSLQLPVPNDVREQEVLLYNSFLRSERVTKLPLSLQFK